MNLLENYRYERKFFIESLNRHDVEHILRRHPARFSEVFEERKINNFYFDTHDLNSYRENNDGVKNRTKLRVRWYGDDIYNILSPVLEIKIKKGLLGTKERYPLKSINFNIYHSIGSIKKCISASNLPLKLKYKLNFLSPSFMNRYMRKYFLSFDKKYRITIDFNQAFYRLSNNTLLRKHVDQNNVILELKYDSHNDDDARYITNNFPFRLSKNSKYVNGVHNLFS